MLSFSLTNVLQFLGGVPNVVLTAPVSEGDAHLVNSRPGTMTDGHTDIRHKAEGLTCHGSLLHVVHLLHSLLQIFFVVVATQGKLLIGNRSRWLMRKWREWLVLVTL